MKSSVLYDRAYAFAIRIVKMYQFLSTEKKEFILSKQVVRSGTAIGANISEAGYAQTRLDFISKMSIAAKEANETLYWLKLLKDTSYISQEAFASIEQDVAELQRLLISSIKTAKGKV